MTAIALWVLIILLSILFTGSTSALVRIAQALEEANRIELERERLAQLESELQRFARGGR